MSIGRRIAGGLPLTIVMLGLAGFVFAVGGDQPSSATKHAEPYTIETPAGTDIARLTLEPRAVERLGIKTVVVRQSGNRLIVPAGAALVDITGEYWVYVNPEPNVYMRHHISLVRFDGERAVLRAGPPAGSRVVTEGAAELHGAEFGIGK